MNFEAYLVALRFIRTCRRCLFKRNGSRVANVLCVTQQRRSSSGCEYDDLFASEHNDGCGFPQETHLLTITKTCFLCWRQLTNQFKASAAVASLPRRMIYFKVIQVITNTSEHWPFEKRIGAQLNNQLPAFNENRQLIAVFTSARHWILSFC